MKKSILSLALFLSVAAVNAQDAKTQAPAAAQPAAVDNKNAPIVTGKQIGRAHV